MIEYVRETLFQEESTFNLVNAVYKDVNGVDISWDEGISASSILNALLDDYCGTSGPFDGIVILFDEFGRYLEYASNNNSAKLENQHYSKSLNVLRMLKEESR